MRTITRNKIGGTAISAILGMNPWKSKYGIYLDLIGEGEEKPDNDSMARGRKWESTLVQIYETIMDIAPDEFVGRRSCEKLIHPEHDFIAGTPDMMYQRRRADNEDAWGLEVKTADYYTRDKYDCEVGVIPNHYYLQCQFYSGLAGFDRWDFIVGFFRDGKFSYHETCSFEFDQELYDYMIEAAIAFWNEHVVPRNPPEITEPAEIIEVVRKTYPLHSDGKYIESDYELEIIVECIREEVFSAKASESRMESLKSRVIERIGDAEGVITELGKITFKANKDSVKTDWKAFSEDAMKLIADPSVSEELLNKHTKTTPGHRVLRFPRWKEEE